MEADETPRPWGEFKALRHPLALVWFLLRTLRMNDVQRLNVWCGLEPDFELPYPYPRNEHEEGMNWVAVNRPISGRSNW